MVDETVFFLVFLLTVMLFAVPLGRYMSRVFRGERTVMTPLVRPLERVFYRVCSIDESEEMSWRRYAYSLVTFHLIGIVFLFLLQLLQGMLPLNPEQVPAVRWDTALNAAVSFVTNTNWQSYAGETTLSYLTQMIGMTLQNFLSAAVGISASLALVRGFVRKNAATVGNFWVDMTRSLLYVLLPLSVILALILVSQGVIQTLGPHVTVYTLEGSTQTIPVGPVASQEAIKMLGSNGGGFFNANSAHPFENPNNATNSLEMLAILLLPMSLVFTFGHLVGDVRQGRAIFFAMMVLFLMGVGVALYVETQLNPMVESLGVSGGNMEGKEMIFGVSKSVLWGTATTAVANGGVNSMHDSAMPLTGLVYLFNMGIGEAIFGGVGSGLITMVFYVIMTMFIAGLMVGRTPEYLGKKLGPYEMGWTSVALLVPPAAILVFSSVAISSPQGLSSLNNPSAHGLSEIIYAYASALGNNGSAFAGLNANTVFYNVTTALGMLIGRFVTLIPALAIAGSLAKKSIAPTDAAAFPSTSALFVLMLVSVVIIVGALTFFPVFSLGPILEHLLLSGG